MSPFGQRQVYRSGFTQATGSSFAMAACWLPLGGPGNDSIGKTIQTELRQVLQDLGLEGTIWIE